MPPDPAFRDYVRRFQIKTGETILDIGSGTGRMIPFLHEAVGSGGRIIAQDLAERMLSEGRELNQFVNVDYVCDDAHYLAYKSNKFDKVLCFSAFPHFGDKQTVLDEISRILKPGGHLLILHTQGSEAMNRFHVSLTGPVNQDRLPHSSSMPELLKKAGLLPVNIEESESIYWVEAEK